MGTQELYCPKDFNLGDFREDHCNVGGIPCPAPLEADPEQVVQVSCGPCGRFWGIPIDKVMKGKVSGFHSCSRAECAAKIIQAVAPAAAAPAGVSLVDDRELASLHRRDETLSKLEAAGVDNWEGYPAMGEDEEDDLPDLSGLSYGQGEATPPAPAPAAPAPATTGKSTKPRK